MAMKTMRRIAAIFSLLLVVGLVRGDFETPLAITNVKVVTGLGTTIDSATIVIAKGRIVSVGGLDSAPPEAERVDGTGLIAYPGFIDGHVHLGVPSTERTAEERQRTEDENPDPKLGPIPAMHQANRRGVRAHLRGREQFVPDGKALESHRNVGFTAALVAPRDGLFGGTSDLMDLAGGPIRRSVIATDVGMHASFQTGEPGEYPQTLLGVFALFRQVMMDARWYAELKNFIEQNPSKSEPLVIDPTLEALQSVLGRSRRIIFEANTENEIRRALELAKEFNLEIIISGGKEAWKVLDRLKAERIPVIVSLKFDDEPEYGRKAPKERGGRPGPRGPKKEGEREKSEDAPKLEGVEQPGKVTKEKDKDKEKKFYEPLRVRQEQRRLWEEQVANIIRLQEAGIPYAIRTRDFTNPADFLKNLRMVMERGLTEDAAVAGLATFPGQLFASKGQLGAIAPGRLANLTLMSKPLKDENSKVKFVFIEGKKFVVEGDEEKSEDSNKPKEEEKPQDSADAKAEGESKEASSAEPDSGPTFASELQSDRVPKTKTGGTVLIKNATVIPVASANLEGADVLIRDGKIAEIGKTLSVPTGVTVIDATGKYVMPGIVDCHSHLGLDGINESALAISAEVRIADVVNPQSVGIFRAVAGGTTTHHAMHGSANPIGGQNVILKLKYGRPASEMIVAKGTRTVKFALGENVVQANFPTNWGNRFPNTRMGVESTIRTAFREGTAYQSAWDEFNRRKAAGEAVVPFRRDIRLEALADILAGKISIHCHCYRSDEILRLFEVVEEFGIRVGCLHHVLEGYRIAPEIARHGSGASSFANMWAYKVEAYQAIPHNAALLTRQGVNASVNSDSSDTIRYLQQEAAKCVRWGGLNENEALRLVTLNPAMQLEIDQRVGSLEVGKDGDLAIFNGHPLNTFSKCVMTIIEGEVYFEDDAATGPTEGLTFRAPPESLDRTIPSTPHRAYAITNATIHTMSAGGDPAQTIANGTVVIVEDKIQAVGAGVAIPPGAGIVDAKGLHVYPGLIDAGGTIGLGEIEMVRPTQDAREIGTYNPHILAHTAVHPHSEHIPITRGVGFTTCLVRPSGGSIAGQSAVIRLDGWTAAEMSVVESLALHLTVPSLPLDLAAEWTEPAHHDCSTSCMRDVEAIEHLGERPFRRRGAMDEEGKKKQRDEHKKSLRDFEDYLAKAKHYAKVKELAAKDPKIEFEADLGLDAMIPYLKGEKPVAMEASNYKQILDSIEFAEKHGLKVILMRAPESWKLADELAKKQIPVILSPPTTYPSGDFEPWDSVFACPAELDRAGVRFCFGSGSTADAYNMSIEVGMAVAHGLPRAKAEFALTQGAAEILGIGDRIGSIEVGKQADLIVTTDSPLLATSQVSHVFIAGKPVGLSSLHTQNHDKFKNRPKPALPSVKDLRGPKSLTTK